MVFSKLFHTYVEGTYTLQKNLFLAHLDNYSPQNLKKTIFYGIFAVKMAQICRKKIFFSKLFHTYVEGTYTLQKNLFLAQMDNYSPRNPQKTQKTRFYGIFSVFNGLKNAVTFFFKNISHICREHLYASEKPIFSSNGPL